MGHTGPPTSSWLNIYFQPWLRFCFWGLLSLSPASEFPLAALPFSSLILVAFGLQGRSSECSTLPTVDIYGSAVLIALRPWAGAYGKSSLFL